MPSTMPPSPCAARTSEEGFASLAAGTLWLTLLMGALFFEEVGAALVRAGIGVWAQTLL